MEIRPTQIDELPELADFLSDNGAATAPHILHWKLWESPGAAEDQPSSFVACTDGRIVGHIGVLPASVHAPTTPSGSIRAGWFVDWMVAEEMRSRGIGIFLLRQASQTYRCLMTIQGSVETRAALEQLNWTRNDSLAVYKLNLRAGPSPDSGIGQRIATELARVVRYHPIAHPAPNGWRLAAPTGDEAWYLLDQVSGCQTESRSGPFSYCPRSGDFLRWSFRDCPGRSYRLAMAFEREWPSGYAIWRAVEREDGRRDARIVDVGLPWDRPDVWRWFISAITARLAGEGVVQVSCLAGVESPLGASLSANRYLPRQVLPVWTCPQASELGPATPWHLTFADSDIDTAAREPTPAAKECAV